MQDIPYMRIRYLMKQCMLQQETDDERSELDSYTQSPHYQQYIHSALMEAYAMDKPLEDLSALQQEQMWTALRIVETLDQKKSKPVRLYRWSAVAAAVLLIAGWIFYSTSDNIDKQLQSPPMIADVDWSSAHSSSERKSSFIDPMPAQQKALMTLSDGSNIDIGELEKGEIITRAGLKIEKLDRGNLSIQFESDKEIHDSGRMNTITTPKGAFYNIKLGDGTKVQLNASSTLRFPSRFGISQRDVHLTGEGYFEVSKDKLRKFVVHSAEGKQKQQVIVYGTVFNIMAYPEKQQFITTLLEGSVKVIEQNSRQEIFLVPHQQAVLQGERLDLRSADINASLAWKNNLFYFAEERLEDVMIEISRWYDVNIYFDQLLLDYKVWAQISRNKPLSEVLELLASTNDIQFDIKGKEVFIRMK